MQIELSKEEMLEIITALDFFGSDEAHIIRIKLESEVFINEIP